MTDLVFAGVAKSFGAGPVLSDINLSVASGSLVAVLGPSGSGKTTLLRLICGFERVDAGTIHIDGAIVSGERVHVAPERRLVGYVAQDGALFPHLSVADNIAFGLPRRERRNRRRIEELLDLVGLPHRYATRPPQELSGGEQQRVALARALAPGPKLVLLDEPFSSLDAGLRNETRRAVAAVLRQTGSTAILVTHDQAEALSLGHQVAVLIGARIAQIDRPEALYRRPVNAAVARFLGDAILVRGMVSKGRADCGLGPLDLDAKRSDGAVEVLIRPEQFRLVPDGSGAPAKGIVTDVAFYGHEAMVRLRLHANCFEGSDLEIIVRVNGYACPRVEEEIGIVVDGPVVAFPNP